MKLALMAGWLGALAFGSVAAQEYPNKPVRIVVPFVPGGTVDLVARVLAQRLTEQMGQPFIVENKAGANGTIGSDTVAKSKADGYMLLVQSPTLIATPLMAKRVPYDTVQDFTPISRLGSVPMVMTAHPSVPAANLREFIAAAQAKPGEYAFGIPAAGSPMHLAGAAIKHNSKLDIAIIPYKGTAAALNDLLGGQISVMIDAIPSSAAHIASGKLKALAVTTPARLPSMPKVPTVAESGMAGFEMVSWYGLWAPAQLPPEILKRLSAETAKAMRSPLVKERLGSLGFLPDPDSPQDFTSFILKETATYARIVRDASIQIE
ncbi:MAG TPA: tripartite tricarboxylate transporter substrate binding protein [Ideonella sp.]|nr:tripartite tricarboxylate transporter substrate binding protein [Ideonella sp.]